MLFKLKRGLHICRGVSGARRVQHDLIISIPQRVVYVAYTAVVSMLLPHISYKLVAICSCQYRHIKHGLLSRREATYLCNKHKTGVGGTKDALAPTKKSCVKSPCHTKPHKESRGTCMGRLVFGLSRRTCVSAAPAWWIDGLPPMTTCLEWLWAWMIVVQTSVPGAWPNVGICGACQRCLLCRPRAFEASCRRTGIGRCGQLSKLRNMSTRDRAMI